MPNTFPRTYLNSEPISLVVRSMVLPQKDVIFMIPRPLQKLGDDSFVVSTGGTKIGGWRRYSVMSSKAF